MLVKRIYILVILITLASLGLVFISKWLLLTLYGYPIDIIGSSKPEAFQAAREISPMSYVIFYAAVIVNFICFIFSLVLIFVRTHVNRVVAFITCCFNLFLFIIYAMGYIASSLVGAMCC